jgi:hypothetical protein
MKPIAAPTIAVLALLLAVTSISTARTTYKTPTKCPPAHAHVLIGDEQAQVYDEPYSEGIYGCIYGGDHLQDLGPTPKYSSQSGVGIELPKLAGTIVAYAETLIILREPREEHARYLIVVRNLRTGQILHRIPTGTFEGPEPEFNKGVGPARMIVVKSNGSVAWIAQNYKKGTKSAPYYELHTIDKLGSRGIAASTEISPKSLTLAGSTLYWTQGGKPMSAPLE